MLLLNCARCLDAPLWQRTSGQQHSLQLVWLSFSFRTAEELHHSLVCGSMSYVLSSSSWGPPQPPALTMACLHWHWAGTALGVMLHTRAHMTSPPQPPLLAHHGPVVHVLPGKVCLFPMSGS